YPGVVPAAAGRLGPVVVGADEVARDRVAVAADEKADIEAYPVHLVDDEPAHRRTAATLDPEQVHSPGQGGAADLDLELGVVADRQRIHARARLRIAVDQHRLGDRRHRVCWTDRVDTRARDVELNLVRDPDVGGGVGVDDRLPQGTG